MRLAILSFERSVIYKAALLGALSIVLVFSTASRPAGASVSVPTLGHFAAAPKEKVIYSFSAVDGQYPTAPLLSDGNGALYGTTLAGGAGCMGSGGCGVVFKLVPVNKKYKLAFEYSFKGGNDGAYPWGGLVADSSGSLYGTTQQGGTGPCYPSGSIYFGCGTVFKLTPSGSTYAETILYNFQGGNDGYTPYDSLVIDKSGALYGTTIAGGGSPACGTLSGGGPVGCGTVFALSRSGSGYKEKVLHAFQGSPNDGATLFAGITLGASGTLLGTTAQGGTGSCSAFGISGCGTVFSLKASGKNYKVLHSFQGAPDGQFGFGNVLFDSSTGDIIGATQYGGNGPCSGQTYVGCGAVYTMAPVRKTYTEAVVYNFQGPTSDAFDVFGTLLRKSDGSLYGTSGGGGAYRGGTVFRLAPSGSSYTETFVYSFRGAPDGLRPYAGLVADAKGTLYGTTYYGGTGPCSSGGCGTVYRITP